MAPDFEYFLRMSPQDRYGHTFPGVFLFTLPLALLTLWIFHAYVKTQFVELMPDQMRCRLAPIAGKFRFGGASRFALILASLLVGIGTHIVWDSFTHGNTRLTRHWAVLRHPVHVPRIGFVPLYKLLQHSSTVMGLAIVFVWLVARRHTVKEGPEYLLRLEAVTHGTWPLRRILILASMATIATLGAILRASMSIGIPSNHTRLALFMGDVAATMIALMWWQFVALGIWRSRNLAG